MVISTWKDFLRCLICDAPGPEQKLRATEALVDHVRLSHFALMTVCLAIAIMALSGSNRARDNRLNEARMVRVLGQTFESVSRSMVADWAASRSKAHQCLRLDTWQNWAIAVINDPGFWNAESSPYRHKECTPSSKEGCSTLNFPRCPSWGTLEDFAGFWNGLGTAQFCWDDKSSPSFCCAHPSSDRVCKTIPLVAAVVHEGTKSWGTASDTIDDLRRILDDLMEYSEKEKSASQKEAQRGPLPRAFVHVTNSIRFQDHFPSLGRMVGHAGQVRVSDLVTKVEQARRYRNRPDEATEIMGVSIEWPFVSRTGIVIILFFMLYFLSHLRSLVAREIEPVRNCPWIGLYDRKLAYLLLLLSVVFLPAAAGVLLLVRAVDEHGGWCEAWLETGQFLFLVAGLLYALCLMARLFILLHQRGPGDAEHSP